MDIAGQIQQNEQRFNQYLEAWKVRARETAHFSSPVPLFDCQAYREIVSMGQAALPLLRKAYDRDSRTDFPLAIIQAHGLVRAVRDIIGPEFSIPENIRGDMLAIEEFTRNWLDTYFICGVPKLS